MRLYLQQRDALMAGTSPEETSRSERTVKWVRYVPAPEDTGGRVRGTDREGVAGVHADESMSAVYRQRISKQRLEKVAETVRLWLRAWLFQPISEMVSPCCCPAPTDLRWACP